MFSHKVMALFCCCTTIGHEHGGGAQLTGHDHGDVKNSADTGCFCGGRRCGDGAHRNGLLSWL